MSDENLEDLSRSIYGNSDPIPMVDMNQRAKSHKREEASLHRRLAFEPHTALNQQKMIKLHFSPVFVDFEELFKYVLPKDSIKQNKWFKDHES